jgi:asparagine synthase (glutamine-hydrolysing)
VCGFAGILDLTRGGIASVTIERQLGLLRHRGPDQSAVHVSPGGRLGLGACRLSIVDVAGGSQPLVNEDGSILLAYNGETYNAPALLRALEESGHRPRSRSDGEVLLHGYEQWGIRRTLESLRGMLAAALWDERRGRLILARDRFGIKPVYYAVRDRRLCFASEVKAILAAPGFPREADPQALDAFLQVGFVSGSRTVFAHVEELPPAHFLVADASGVRIEPYWRLDWSGSDPVPEAEAAERFRDALREAVLLRLPSEVPFGVLVSGGIDSSAVAGLAAAQYDRPLRTFSIAFEDPAFDETPWARAVASHLRAEHHVVEFRDADWDQFPAVMRGLEEPSSFGTPMVLWKLFAECRAQGMTVLLSGEGSDELLGGYAWLRGDRLARPLLGLPAPLRRALAALPLPASDQARLVLRRGNRSVARRYVDWHAPADGATVDGLLSLELRSRLPRDQPNPVLAAWDHDEEAIAAPLDQAIALHARTSLPDSILHRVDRMSMAHSIEARVPFLDHRLWELAARVPARLKMRGGVEKHLLRESMRGIVPDDVRRRRKQALVGPIEEWLRRERWPEWAESCFTEQALRSAGLFAPAPALELRRAQRERPVLGRILFAVLTTQLWHHELLAGR